MKKFFMAALLAVTMVFAGCGTGEGDTNKSTNSMKYSQIIVVGVDDEFPPMCFHDEHGNLIGFDIDLAKEVAKRMGVEFEFKHIDWNTKRDELLSGNVDMIWSGCDITDKRKEYMIFSKPYMDNRQILLVRHGNPTGIHAEGDLEGKIVGTKAGSSVEDYIDDNKYFKSFFAKFVTYRNEVEGLELLRNGELDVMIIDEIAARYVANRHPEEFDPVEATIGSYTEIAIAFRKNDAELRDKVQKAFDDMIHDGTAKRISEQWFQSDLIKTVR